jgi:energy-converting hydrogenase Eha subunit E
MVHGLLYLVPALLLGWLIAGWVAAMPIALSGGHVVAAVISAFAWVGMALTVYFAGSTGLHALTLAYHRWPDRVPGTVMVGATFAALVIAFAIEPPTIWFTDIRLTMPGAIALAFAATFWFYGPIITVALAVLRKVRPFFPAVRVLDRVHEWRGILVRVGIALAAGIGIALLALPFYKGALGLPTDVERYGMLAAMGKAVANAVTDELFLRLFVFTAALGIAIRYLRREEHWAVLLAIAVATVADLLLHWPSVSALGIPSVPMILAYGVARIAIPAIVFGFIYWRRGLGTAVAAHAIAGAAVGLLAL